MTRSEHRTHIKISTHSLTKRLTANRAKEQLLWLISTHSLTKRLTMQTQMDDLGFTISTHSLTKRLTSGGMLCQSSNNFNSQPHEEADRECDYWECGRMSISTHSLTKRLTIRIISRRSILLFQLTASRRG